MGENVRFLLGSFSNKCHGLVVVNDLTLLQISNDQTRCLVRTDKACKTSGQCQHFR